MPENENGSSPKKKKRGFLWTIIIILVIILAATIGGYALFYYNALPAWITDMLPASEISATPIPNDFIQEQPSPSPALSTEEEPEETAAVSADTADKREDNAQSAPAVTAVPYIGADAAADAALEHSKVNEKDADFSSVMLTEQNGLMLYEVVFTAGDLKYEYYIDGSSGRVESWKKTDTTLASGDTLAASSIDEPAATAAPDTEKDPDSSSSSKPGATVLLGEDEAKKLAMAHANITEKDISSISCKIELQGLNLIYEVEMKTKLMEYEYEVDAITGEIVGFDVEPIKGV